MINYITIFSKMKKPKVKKCWTKKHGIRKKLDIIPTHPNKYTDSELFWKKLTQYRPTTLIGILHYNLIYIVLFLEDLKWPDFWVLFFFHTEWGSVAGYLRNCWWSAVRGERVSRCGWHWRKQRGRRAAVAASRRCFGYGSSYWGTVLESTSITWWVKIWI